MTMLEEAEQLNAEEIRTERVKHLRELLEQRARLEEYIDNVQGEIDGIENWEPTRKNDGRCYS